MCGIPVNYLSTHPSIHPSSTITMPTKRKSEQFEEKIQVNMIFILCYWSEWEKKVSDYFCVFHFFLLLLLLFFTFRELHQLQYERKFSSHIEIDTKTSSYWCVRHWNQNFACSICANERERWTKTTEHQRI